MVTSKITKNFQDYIDNYPEWFTTPNAGYSFPNAWEPIICKVLKHIAWRHNRWQEVLEIKARLEREGKNIDEEYPWIISYFENNPLNPWRNFHIDQIKIKFGELRFYFSGVEDQNQSFVDGLVCMAEDWCNSITVA